MNGPGAKQKTALADQLAGLHAQLGIPADYGRRHMLEPCAECTELVSIGPDIFEREQRLHPGAARAWKTMKTAAAAAGVELRVVSAFRSVDYQAAIIRRKLDAGQAMSSILEVSAAPGFSEHHTGRALDLTCPGYEPLEEDFERSPAFEWLCHSASTYGFRMSYPRDNRHGVAYEPWHWYWTG